jgi:manganese-dependent inorganic pyrophosphatase
MKFMESGLSPSPAVAGTLLCGILSDTLSLRMSTTTHQDRQAVKFLARVSGEDPEKLGIALLEQGMDLSGVTLPALLARDTKEFALFGRRVLVAQVMVPAFGWNRDRAGPIRDELERMRTEAGADLALALFTNVLENASDLAGAGDPGLIRELFGSDLPACLPGVMSRKKDFLPLLGEKLRGLARP